MSKLPAATPHTDGRTFGTDWSIANVATLLRANAARGTWHAGSPTGSMAKVNQNYLRTVSARHLPSNLSLIFMRLDQNEWYASLCFAANDEPLPWNAEMAELWLRALFAPDLPQILDVPAAPGSRQFFSGTKVGK